MQAVLNEEVDSISANASIVDVKSLAMQGGRRQTKKRKRVGRACIFCQRSHMSCDEFRPCRRCIARGCSDQCRDPDGKRKRRGRKRKVASLEGELELITSSSESEVQEQRFNSEFCGYNDNGFEQFGPYENNLDSEIQKQNFSNPVDSQFFNSEIFSDSEEYEISHRQIIHNNRPAEIENYLLYTTDHGEYIPSLQISVPNRKSNSFFEQNNFNLSTTPTNLLFNDTFNGLQEIHTSSSPLVAGTSSSYGSFMGGGYLASSPHVDRVFDDQYFVM